MPKISKSQSNANKIGVWEISHTNQSDQSSVQLAFSSNKKMSAKATQNQTNNCIWNCHSIVLVRLDLLTFVRHYSDVIYHILDTPIGYNSIFSFQTCLCSMISVAVVVKLIEVLKFKSSWLEQKDCVNPKSSKKLGLKLLLYFFVWWDLLIFVRYDSIWYRTYFYWMYFYCSFCSSLMCLCLIISWLDER